MLVNNEATPVQRDEVYRSIGFCSQDNFATMEDTVYENLCFFGESKGLSESRIDLEIDALMIKFGLKPFMYTLASKLSGGALRKLNIAIALLNSPRVLILDEPTSGRVFLAPLTLIHNRTRSNFEKRILGCA